MTKYVETKYRNADLTDGSSVTGPIYSKNKNKSARIYGKKVSDALAERAVSTWTTRTSAVNNLWWSICWSSELGLFVAVAATGTGNRVMTSPDGITWTSRKSAADKEWRSVCWSAELGIFVAVSYTSGANNVMTSLDGITWTERVTPNIRLLDVCWSPELGLFVAVPYGNVNNTILTSPDGINWTARTNANVGLCKVCWSAELGLFAATVYGSSSFKSILTSPDGINWTEMTTPLTEFVTGICWSPELGLFVAVANSGTNRIITSPDGINWTIRLIPVSNTWRVVTWSSELGLFVVTATSGAGNRIMTSPDGTNWTTRTSAVDNDWVNICWSPELGIFVAVATSGTGNRVMTSKFVGYAESYIPANISSSTGFTIDGVLLKDGDVVGYTKEDPVDVAEIPPSLDLDFSTKVPSTITFSRSSIATYFDQDGYLKTASANVPRIEYDSITRQSKGLLIEEARSNLLLRSDEMWDTTSWSFDGCVASAGNVTTSPSGVNDATKIIENSANSIHAIRANDVTISTNTIYTFSAFIKAAERNYAQIAFWNGANTVSFKAYIDLINGVISTTDNTGSPTNTNSGIQSIGNGWYRVWVTANLGAFTTADCYVYTSNALNANVYQGDGKSGLYIWGAQLEAGAFPTSYIPSQQTWTDRTGTGGTAVASYYDSTGVLKYTGVARTTYNPSPDKLHLSPKLLLEPEATNNFLQSEDFSTTWVTENSTVSSASIVKPDGTSTASNILISSTASSGNFGVIQFFSATDGIAFTVSFYVKRGTYAGIFAIRNLTQSGTVYFTPETKTITRDSGTDVSGSIQELPNGWYRLSATFLPTSTQSLSIRLRCDASTAVGQTAYFWGAQLEAGYAPTSYIPTTTATVKRYADSYTSAVLAGGRLADSASMTGSNFTGWYRWDEGTVYSEWQDKLQSFSHSIFSIYQDGSNRIGLEVNTSNILDAIILLGSNVNDTLDSLTPSTTITNKANLAFKLNDGCVSHNGFVGPTDTSVIVPNLSFPTLHIGTRDGSVRHLNGHILRLIFWPKRLDNDKLQLMTK